MIFNSIEFALFLPVVFILYWFVFKRFHVQNLLIVFASYVFYGWWDWRFLTLILVSTIIDYIVGLALGDAQKPNKRKGLLLISLLSNLGILGVFKYYDFFVDNFITLMQLFGFHTNISLLNVILPVGISFYTFQTLSYSIDIYRKKIEPTKNFIAFAAFVSFFPQLVAGPIERASNLLPQFLTKRKFNYHEAADGSKQILIGLFKKVVVADNCAIMVNQIFEDYAELNAVTLILGAVLFSFQIYGDFSGYSDIAIGTARLFGFNLARNFAYPYLSRDIAEFWRRWHISLSSWFKDYLYIPLGGSRGGRAVILRNTFAIFLVSGFWHGANWTFIIWGGLNALYFIPLLLRGSNRKHIDIVAANGIFPSLKEASLICLNFSLVTFTWIFFRAENLSHALGYIKGIFIDFSLSAPLVNTYDLVVTSMFIFLLIIMEWAGRNQEHAFANLFNLKLFRFKIARFVFYYGIALIIFLFGAKSQEFIYFQF